MQAFPDSLDLALRQRLHLLAVKPEDIEERFVLGTGPGGQKINKTSSTVWLRHGPTGVEARCQNGRSQAANRHGAWAILAAKIEQRRSAKSAAAQHAREAESRRTRQKSRAQKVRMIQAKKYRAKIKRERSHPEEW